MANLKDFVFIYSYVLGTLPWSYRNKNWWNKLFILSPIFTFINIIFYVLWLIITSETSSDEEATVLGMIYVNFCYIILFTLRIFYSKDYEKIMNYPFTENDYISNFRHSFYIIFVIFSVLPSILYYHLLYIIEKERKLIHFLQCVSIFLVETSFNSVECQIILLFEQLEYSFYLINNELESFIKCIRKNQIKKLRQEHTNSSKITRNLLRICESDLFLIISRNAILTIVHFNKAVQIFTDKNYPHSKLEKTFDYFFQSLVIFSSCSKIVWMAKCSTHLTSQVRKYIIFFSVRD